jgi:hypothetical protein
MDFKNFNEKTVTNWPDLFKFYSDKFTSLSTNSPAVENQRLKPGAQWVFRGLSDAKYKLKTSLERARWRFDAPWNELGGMETKMIRQFRRQAHRYLENPPKDDDTIEWLALMQHFGSPTRFQDWTYSFFVALFFAVETAKKHCAVWAIDSDWLREKAELMFPLGAEEYKRENPPYKSGKFFRHVFCHPPYPNRLVYTLNPERLNERLIVQQGLFIAPADISKPFEDNLDAICKNDSNAKDYIWKITIDDKVSLRCDILRHLHRMNINRASLFPGLSGFAESLATYVANPDLLGKIET